MLNSPLNDYNAQQLFHQRYINMRPSARTPGQIRPVTITRQFTTHAEGSVLIEFGASTRAIRT